MSDSDQLKDALTGALVELVAARRAPVSESPAHPPLELDLRWMRDPLRTRF